MLADAGPRYSPDHRTADTPRSDGGPWFRNDGSRVGVVSNRGCPAVSVADGGVLYDDDAGLADALRVARRVDLDAMGQRNRECVRSLTWERVAARTARVYRMATGRAT
jgi:glycosyltransferase involved in cell wall biosynthesis